MSDLSLVKEPLLGDPGGNQKPAHPHRYREPRNPAFYKRKPGRQPLADAPRQHDQSAYAHIAESGCVHRVAELLGSVIEGVQAAVAVTPEAFLLPACPPCAPVPRE